MPYSYMFFLLVFTIAGHLFGDPDFINRTKSHKATLMVHASTHHNTHKLSCQTICRGIIAEELAEERFCKDFLLTKINEIQRFPSLTYI